MHYTIGRLMGGVLLRPGEHAEPVFPIRGYGMLGRYHWFKQIRFFVPSFSQQETKYY